MVFGKSGGIWWSTNEINAMKKNLLEDVKLKTTHRGIHIQQCISKQKIENTTSKVKKELKDIRMSSGYSKQTMPFSPLTRSLSLGSNKSWPSRSECSTAKQTRHDRERERERLPSDPLTAVSYYQGNKPRKTSGIKVVKTKIRPITLEPQYKRTLDFPAPTIIRRSLSEGAKLILCEREMTLTDCTADVQYMADDDDKEFFRPESTGLHTTGNQRMESNVSHEKPREDKNKSPLFGNKGSSFVFNKDGSDLDEEITKYLESIDLPKIKNCQRRLCKHNCGTCRQRKLKNPCFNIPGLTTKLQREGLKSDSKSDVEKSEGSSERCFSRLSIEDDCHSKIGASIDGKSTPTHMLSRESTVCSGIKNMVKYIVPKDHKKASKQRLMELATPRDRIQSTHITKASLRRELARLQKSMPKQPTQNKDTINKQALQKRVRIFLAMLNLNEKQSIPSKMVDIPMRDDVMKVDLTVMDIPDMAVQGHSEVNRLISSRRRKHVNFI